jgi:7-cyano-7-deazaguanine synthase
MNVLLFSGGVDSTALAYMIRPDLALTIDYGQRCAPAEIDAATQIAAEIGLKQEIITIDCRSIGQGEMADSGRISTQSPNAEWWPFRNQLLATIAAAYMIDHEDVQLIFGTVSSDAAHGDGRAEFFENLNRLLRGQEGGVAASAPALNLTTQELVLRSGVTPGILGWSFSCHRSNLACGQCRGCIKRREALALTGHQL